MKQIGHWIDGKLVPGTSGRFTDVMNPATGEVQAQLALATAAELDAAVDDAMASPYLQRSLAALRAHVARVRRLARDNPARLAQAAQEHRLICAAIADGDEVLAGQATAVHLRASLEHVLTSLPTRPTTDGAPR